MFAAHTHLSVVSQVGLTSGQRYPSLEVWLMVCSLVQILPS